MWCRVHAKLYFVLQYLDSLFRITAVVFQHTVKQDRLNTTLRGHAAVRMVQPISQQVRHQRATGNLNQHKQINQTWEKFT